ncbi:MAG: L-lactate permease [Bryobacteraceae bacterium]|nr:L-lactate permease [Bryobacteraceae bacterium]MDW8378670.1 lactate permease LctP family transporter [Bryobacterales bacterium]
MWRQHYTPLGESLALSASVAALPIFVLLLLLGVLRKPAWVAGLSGLATAIAVALGAYGMPPGLVFGSVTFGAAFGLLPIGWIVYWAIVLYRIALETGKFEMIKDSIGGLTNDRRLQALLIAFSFGAFVEGAAGFGTPVAVAAAMLAGLGFSPFYAAGICLLANTAPVAFGSIGIPVSTLAGITGLPAADLSANVGRICAPVSLIVPGYLILVMGGWKALRGVLPAAIVCGGCFAVVQFLVSNYLGPELTDILSSLAAIVGLVLLFRFWRPTDQFELAGAAVSTTPKRHKPNEILLAWSPYLLLVGFVLLWGQEGVRKVLNSLTITIPWPMLHNLVERVPPVVSKASPYSAVYSLNWLSAAGTACLFSTILAAVVLQVSWAQYLRILRAAMRQLFLSLVTIAAVLGLAFLMNYCGATATLGLAFAATGALFPFFSAILGWLGVFLTGSDTSANALFGNLQVVTANKLSLNPMLMAASNSSGGVMGKMISLQSLAVAAAATGMPSHDEAKLFRFTLKHSILLASVIGLVVVFYAYLAPGWVR